MLEEMLETLRFLVVLIAVAYLGIGLFALLFANRMIFPIPPVSYVPSPAIQMISGAEGGHAIATLYLRNENASRLILFSHGNFEDLGTVRPRLEVLREQGFSILAWDYPGYGLSEGKPRMSTVNAGIEAVFAHALELGYSSEDIVLHGFSIGGGPTLHLASREPVAAVILESTFLSVFRLIAGMRLMPWDIFDNQKLIQEVRAPLLVIHGTDDGVVPFSHAKGLLARAPEPRTFLWVDGAGHNGLIEVAGAAYWQSVRDFIHSTTNQPEPR